MRKTIITRTIKESLIKSDFPAAQECAAKIIDFVSKEKSHYSLRTLKNSGRIYSELT